MSDILLYYIHFYKESSEPAYAMVYSTTSILRILLILTYLSSTMAWIGLVRTFPIAEKPNKRVPNATAIDSKFKQKSGCRKDKHCQPSEYCNRYEKTCLNCRKEGETCRRNKMCCRGMECAGGVCRRKIRLGTEGALCTKDRECNYGFCCAREKGQNVCKRMLQEGDRCSKPNRLYLWSHQCPCAYGMKCRRRKRTNKLLDLIKDWNDESERRCVRTNYNT
eukprot:TCONS_00011663-protein